MMPLPPHPAHGWQKMQPSLCGIVLRCTFPDPAHWKHAFSAGIATGFVTGVPHFGQKRALLAMGDPHDEQNTSFLR
jgi:hypothetical protein